MIPHLRTLACAAALFAAAGLSAQDTPDCPDGRANEEGPGATVSFTGTHPTHVADAVDSVLARSGYTAPASGTTYWQTVPRFTWIDGMEPAAIEGVQHPGIEVAVRLEEQDKKVEVVAAARTICRAIRGGQPADDLENALELLTITSLARALEARMAEVRAAGVDVRQPVDRLAPFPVQIPQEVGGFRYASRRDYVPSDLGVSLRYGAGERYADVYVYRGTEVTADCDPACAVDAEADGFITSFPELIRVGYYESIDLAGREQMQPGPRAPWRAGRHLTLRVKMQGEAKDSHFYLFSFPGFMVKVRATFPPSADAQREMEAFVQDLLPKLMREG